MSFCMSASEAMDSLKNRSVISLSRLVLSTSGTPFFAELCHRLVGCQAKVDRGERKLRDKAVIVY